jgi:hypothetical protein
MCPSFLKIPLFLIQIKILIQPPRHNQFKLRNRNFQFRAIFRPHKRIKTIHFAQIAQQMTPRFIPILFARRHRRLTSDDSFARNFAHRHTRIMDKPMSVRQTHCMQRLIFNRNSISEYILPLVRATQIQPIAMFDTNFNTVCD